MRDADLLQLALALVPPWLVTRSDFDAAARRLDIHIDFARSSRFACPNCGAADCPAYDSEALTWRHLNFFQHQAYLHARVPRVRCTNCGVKKVSVPWAREGSGFTLLFEALTMALVSAMPVKAVARLVGEHDTRLWQPTAGSPRSSTPLVPSSAIGTVSCVGSTAKSPMASSKASIASSRPPRLRPAATAPPETW
jgi:transposase